VFISSGAVNYNRNHLNLEKLLKHLQISLGQGEFLPMIFKNYSNHDMGIQGADKLNIEG
jgi:hypothetical protein